MEPTQTVVARIPASMVRRVRELVGVDAGYRDVSEYIEVALANQLALEEEGTESSATRGHSAPRSDPLAAESNLVLPKAVPSTLAVAAPLEDPEPLSPFTNRLFPIKLSCRVLANCEAGTDLPEFQRRAAAAAQMVGRRVREEDSASGRRGLERRWVALPVGEKASTLNRFMNHFTATISRSGRAGGPMISLGLAEIRDGSPALTELGFELAQAPNPVLEATAGDGALGGEERALLVRAVASNPAEAQSLLSFADVVNAAGGDQAKVDRELRTRNPQWSQEQAAAQRAAVIGRLHDLGLARVSGEGAEAEISLAEMPSDWNGTG